MSLPRRRRRRSTHNPQTALAESGRRQKERIAAKGTGELRVGALRWNGSGTVDDTTATQEHAGGGCDRFPHDRYGRKHIR